MSFNPVLARVGRDESDLMPMPAVGEKMVLKRQGIHVDMKVASKSYAGKGYLFLTTARCVFIKEGKITSHKNWSSLEFPLRTIYGESGSGHPPDFHQPVFGANYMAGVTPPNESAQYPFAAAGVWKWQFKEGGCAAFVKAFYALYKAATRGGQSAVDITAQNIIGAGGAAYMDPSDPSIIFVQQPAPQEPYCFNPESQAYGPMPTSQYPPQQGPYPPAPAHYGAPSPYGPPQYGAPPQGPLPPAGAHHYGYPPPNQYSPPPYPPTQGPSQYQQQTAYPPQQTWSTNTMGAYSVPPYHPMHPTAAGYPPHPGSGNPPAGGAAGRND